MLHSDAVREPDTHTVFAADQQPFVRSDGRPATIRTLKLDGSQWRSQKDFYDALSDLLGSVERHCRSSAVIVESMIYYPDLNVEKPPYEIVISNSSAELRPFLIDFAGGIADAREDRRANRKWGDDVEVVVTIA